MMYDTILNIPVTNKTVFLRCDLNVPVTNGVVVDTNRIEKSLKTIFYLMQNNAKIIICTHFGKPKQYDAKYSTKVIADELAKFVKTKIHFVNSCIGQEVENTIKTANYGEIIFLENIRFHQEEYANDQSFAKELADLCNIYINDAFACSHRAHASISAITEYKKSVAGFCFHEEVSQASKYIKNPENPLTLIMGGSKISTKINIIKHLTTKAKNLFICGGILNTYLKVKGFEIGKSIYEENAEAEVLKIEESLLKNDCHLILPKKVVVLTNENIVEEKLIEKVLKTDTIFDVIDSEELFQCLEASKMCFWNGPLGYQEDARFEIGSVSLAKKIAELTKLGRLKSVAGGGDCVACINKAGVFEDFTFVSTAGGAFLDFMGGKKLSGLEMLILNYTHDSDKVIHKKYV